MKLIEILTQDKKAADTDAAAFEVETQGINLQSYQSKTRQAIAACNKRVKQILKSGGADMWANLDQCNQEIAALEKTQERLAGYATEFLG